MLFSGMRANCLANCREKWGSCSRVAWAPGSRGHPWLGLGRVWGRQAARPCLLWMQEGKPWPAAVCERAHPGKYHGNLRVQGSSTCSDGNCSMVTKNLCMMKKARLSQSLAPGWGGTCFFTPGWPLPLRAIVSSPFAHGGLLDIRYLATCQPGEAWALEVEEGVPAMHTCVYGCIYVHMGACVWQGAARVLGPRNWLGVGRGPESMGYV